MIFEFIIFCLCFFVIFNDFIGLAFSLPFVNLIDHAVVLFFVVVGFLGGLLLVWAPVMKKLGVSRLIIIVFFFSVIAVSRSAVNSNLSALGIAIGYIYYFKFIFLFLSGLSIGFFVKNGRFNKSLLRFFNVLFFFAVLCCAINFAFPEMWYSYVPAQEFSGQRRLIGPFTNAGRTSWLLVLCSLYAAVILGRGVFSRLLFLVSISFLYFTYVKKSVFALLLCLGIIQKNKVKDKGILYVLISYLAAAFGACIFVAVFYDAFARMAIEYSGEGLGDSNSRFILSLGAYNILRESTINLLFGAGFSSWGGFASSVVYSPYYSFYGLDRAWGFIEGSSTYTGDFYIAHVLGETGVLGGGGTVLLCAQLLRIYSKMKCVVGDRFSNTSSKMQFFFYLVLIHIFVESMGICALEINQMIVVVFFLPGIWFGKRIREYMLQLESV